MIDPHRLERKLEARFGLAFSATSERIEGGDFLVVRPVDLAKPNGFGIVIASTPSRMEASFRADAFARTVLRQMAQADEASRRVFVSQLDAAKARGYRVYLAVNGISLDAIDQVPTYEWERFDLECDMRIPVRRATDEEHFCYAFETTATCLSLALALLPIEDVISVVVEREFDLPEGARVRVEVNRYERSPVNRAACIAYFGTTCQVCRFDFESRYGDIGESYIEVHHLIPVSSMGASYRVDPIRDLVPLCANCHAMIHRRTPPFSLEELAARLQNE